MIGGPYTGAVRGQMYDPAVQRALMQKLAHWNRLPESDLIQMLTPVERLRFRPEALRDLEMEGLVTVQPGGDEPVVTITEAGREWLARRGDGEPGRRG